METKFKDFDGKLYWIETNTFHACLIEETYSNNLKI